MPKPILIPFQKSSCVIPPSKSCLTCSTVDGLSGKRKHLVVSSFFTLFPRRECANRLPGTPGTRSPGPHRFKPEPTGAMSGRGDIRPPGGEAVISTGPARARCSGLAQGCRAGVLRFPRSSKIAAVWARHRFPHCSNFLVDRPVRIRSVPVTGREALGGNVRFNPAVEQDPRNGQAASGVRISTDGGESRGWMTGIRQRARTLGVGWAANAWLRGVNDVPS
jgi:hypothetical protein